MSAAAKKPPVPGRDGASTPTSSPSRNPPRASTPSGGPPTSSVARSRSVRSGTPVSARAAAAATRRESPLNQTNSAAAEEQEATLAALDDLKERLSKAEGASDQYQRQAEVLQSKLDEALKEHAQLEEKFHESEEQIETLRNEKREAARQMQQMEAIYEAERSAMTKEKEEMANREEEMQTVIQRLKDTLAQRTSNNEDEGRPSRQSNNNSPGVENGSFAPPSSLHRSDSRNNSKLLLQKDKLIESLRLELAEAQIKLVESENQGGGRLQEVERMLMEARMANARLMEDNESYQLLLQEKTLKGDFGGAGEFGYHSSSAHQDALNALEGRGGGSSLADELSDAAGGDNEMTTTTTTDNYRRLEAELKSQKDENKALTLYINKIIGRLLQHDNFEHILDQSDDFRAGAAGVNTNKALPPPPQSIFQKAKSAMGGSSPAKMRPRPMSFMPSAPQSALTNPDTAPSIPIGISRTSSVRRTGRPMSEQFTGSAAASVMNAMYNKGPDSAGGGGAGSGGPLSPTFRPSTGHSPLYPSGSGSAAGGVAPPSSAAVAGAPSSSSTGQRTPSGAGVPGAGAGAGAAAIPMSTSGNFPGMKSETSSVSGDESNATGEVTTPPSQSPPRNQPHEKTAFTGTKPRPLRLVQENPDSTVKTENKRASWIGWASTAFSRKEEAATLTGGDTIRE